MERLVTRHRVEAEMAALLEELADPVRLAVVAELTLRPQRTAELAAAADCGPDEITAHLAALVAIDVVDRVEARGGAQYRLADPDLGRACAALRRALTFRRATEALGDQRPRQS